MKTILDDVRFQEWRDRLAAEGIRVKIGREAKSEPRGKTDLYLVLFYGDGFQPTHLTAMLQWYPDTGGFQVYYPPKDQTTTGDVALLRAA